MRKRKGFTLIELMIVIAIIAILAAVLVPNFMRAREASRLTACKSNLKNISTSVETYANDYDGMYPGGTNNTRESTLNVLSNALEGSYMGKLLNCPTVRSPNYIYFMYSSGVAYRIYCPARGATTPDHRQGTQTGGPALDSVEGILPRLF